MKTFKSKILLFGEYGLMKGASALSMPFADFSGKLSFEPGLQKSWISNQSLTHFVDYLLGQQINSQLNFPLNLDQLSADIRQGMWFDSNIPQQYGVGSSGALVAAVFDRYSSFAQHGTISSWPIEKLKADFALLESFFHGTSSGLDPLVSYLDHPVLLEQANGITPVGLPADQPIKMFLVDTKTFGATAPLVGYFIRKVNQSRFLQKLLSHFIPVNDFCIEHFLSGQSELFFPELRKLIEFQLRHLKRMIPSPYRKMIRESLESHLFIKLLGSGGGGFLLGFAPNEQIIDDFTRKYQLQVIRI